MGIVYDTYLVIGWKITPFIRKALKLSSELPPEQLEKETPQWFYEQVAQEVPLLNGQQLVNFMVDIIEEKLEEEVDHYNEDGLSVERFCPSYDCPHTEIEFYVCDPICRSSYTATILKRIIDYIEQQKLPEQLKVIFEDRDLTLIVQSEIDVH